MAKIKPLGYLVLVLPLLILPFWQSKNSKASVPNPPSIHQIEDQGHQDFTPPPAEAIENGGGEAAPYAPPEVAVLQKSTFGFYPYWMSNYKSFRFDLLETISYFGVKIEPNGDISDRRGWPNPGLVDHAHRSGTRVVLTARNFSGGEIETLLSNSSNRQRAINNLVAEVRNTGIEGINIDFEGVPSSQKGNLKIFIRDLNGALKGANSSYHLSIDVPAVDWSGVYPLGDLAPHLDQIIIMGYDYHWSSAPTAGPVAQLVSSPKWGSNSVTASLDTYRAQTDQDQKILLGVPYYGYDWPVASDTVPAQTTDRARALYYETVIDEVRDHTRQWDYDSYTPFYKYANHQVWYEDRDSLREKYRVVKEKNVGGIAIWALGYDGDRPELWDLIESEFAYAKPNKINDKLRILTGAGPGGGPHVRGFKADNKETDPLGLMAYANTFHGGIHVAAGDIDKDGLDEIITGPRRSGGPHVRVFEMNGTARALDFWPFHIQSRTGVNVAAGDLDGDGRDEIAVAQDEGGHAWVKTYRYNQDRAIIGEWNAYGNVECGASVAIGDVDGDGKGEVITGAGPGGGPHLRVFEADGRPIGDFFPFHELYRGGIDVAAGDIDKDGQDEIAVCQKSQQAWCKVYRFDRQKTIIGEWRAYGDAPVGAYVEFGDIDQNGKMEVITGAANEGGPHVRAFQPNGLAYTYPNFMAYDPAFRGGTDVTVGYRK